MAAIWGGTQINIVPEECAIEVDRRVIPGEDARDVLDGIVGTLRERLQGSSVDFEVEELLLDWPLGTPPESLIARCAQQVASKSGLEDRLHGVSYGSDASKLQQLKGIPSIVFRAGFDRTGAFEGRAGYPSSMWNGLPGSTLRWREASAGLATVSRRRGGIGRSTLLIWPKEHRLVRGLPQFADPKSRAPPNRGLRDEPSERR